MPPSVHYPRVVRYLASLPSGVDSYPECVAKGSVARQVFSVVPASEFPRPLPESIAEWFVAPPTVSAWVPETRTMALMLALADVSRDEEHYAARVLEMNRALFRGPLYRMLMMLVSPSMLIRAAESRWGAFHRGTTLTVRETERNGAEVSLAFPPRLIPSPVANAFGAAFQAAVEAAGGRDARFTVASLGDQHATYRGAWR